MLATPIVNEKEYESVVDLAGDHMRLPENFYATAVRSQSLCTGDVINA
ncbi:hypothetical protein RESH_02207 [Rhodopirellula europaea SH398]|uniref:Uncharacterized protein n=1 Tax=Rhodopirellula europaea SH398 TaxID=1263868 RepID=M5S6S0_9BACT|nr:hypothetical protein RESH_02207 [Rhodopirellula europaea SH398]